MFTNVFSFFDWATSTSDPQAPHLNYGRIIGEEMTSILLDDPKFHFNFRLRLKQFYYYGAGAVFWPDEFDWRSQAILNANFIVPYNAVSCVDALDFVIIRGELELGDLYDKIEDEEAAAEAGWNVAEVRKLIVKSYRDGTVSLGDEVFMSSEWESIQHQIKNKTDQTDNQFAKIRVVHMLVEEYGSEKGVTHIILPQDDDDIGFLFYGDRRFESMSQSCHCMFYDEGEGYYRSARGLAHELFATSGINDRLTNALLDAAIVSGGLIVQGVSGQDEEDMSTIVKQGPILQLPAGMNLIQNRSFTPPLQPIVEVRRMVQGIQANNSGSTDSIDENFWRGMPEKSATQASLESTNDARFESSMAAWSYVQWESWLKETARRLLNKSYPSGHPGYEEHKQLMDRCRRRGVPDEWLDYDIWDRKRAERAIGLGNPNEARRLTQSLVAMSTQLPEQGARAAMYDWIGVRFGYHRTARYLPEVDPTKQVTNDVIMVQLENNDLANGQPMVPSKDQPQGIHITWHFRWMSELIKPYLQNGPQIPNLGQIAIGLASGIQHVQQHILFLGQDPLRGKQAKAWMDPLRQFTAIYRQIQTDIARIQELQQKVAAEADRRMQEAQQMEDEAQRVAEIEKIRSKERVDMMNILSLDRARDMKTASAIENQNQKVEAEISREDRKADAEIARKAASASE